MGVRFRPANCVRLSTGTRRAGGADGGWPPRAAFRPETIPPAILPNIGLVDVDTAPFRVFYRAVGSAFATSIGKDVSGMYLDESGIPQAADIAEWYRIAIDAPGALFVCGEQTIDRHTFLYEGCCLPLGEPADEPRRFIIAEDFPDTHSWRSALRRRRYDKPV